jgi:hypothetical protein
MITILLKIFLNQFCEYIYTRDVSTYITLLGFTFENKKQTLFLFRESKYLTPF